MAKYRKKPVVIEAEQWLGPESKIAGVRRANEPEVQAHVAATARLMMRPVSLGGLGLDVKPASEFYVVDTLEGLHFVSPGDWIITGVAGEKYPCKPEIFEATYEKVGGP
jgi:hypothetical protein